MERFFKAQSSYNISSLVVSKFTLKILVEIFAYLIMKVVRNHVYFSCDESCFSGNTVLISKFSLYYTSQKLASKTC